MSNPFQFMTCSKCGNLLNMQEMLANHHTDNNGVMHPLCNECERKENDNNDRCR